MNASRSEPQYLYHYTSIEILALILHNKTLCFNSLAYVDDMQEAMTADLGNFGKYVYVSCWTEDEKESIPLWNMYTPNMRGVRIRLRKYPFKVYHYKRGQHKLKEDIDTYIDLDGLYRENKLYIAGQQPILCPITYTDDPEKLFPRVKTESYPGVAQDNLAAPNLSSVKSCNVKYSTSCLGKVKGTQWKFQKEWRYIITTSPLRLQDFENISTGKEFFHLRQELIQRLENRDIDPPQKRIFLDLADDAFENLEIVLGPRMSEADKILTKALVSQFCPQACCRDSVLMIR